MYKSLQDKIDALGNPAEFLRNVPVGAYIYPVQSQFTNWRDEHRSWHDDVALLDQSLHMTDLYVEGPDLIRLLSEVAINSFKNFGRNKGKQLICCNDDGYLIGDMILFGLEDDKVNIVGRPVVANWIQYKIESGDYDVTFERDERQVNNPNQRKTYRFELQGPKAWALLEKLNGGPIEQIGFFKMGEIKIEGRRVRALGHAFAGAPGLEFWGPWQERDEIRDAIIRAGEEFNLRRNYMVNRINAIPRVSVVNPQGAFYVLVNIGQLGLNSTNFADRLLSKHHVAVVAGIAFGNDNTVRLSYATSLDIIKKGLDRFEEFCKTL